MVGCPITMLPRTHGASKVNNLRNIAANFRQLFSGAAARRLLEDAAEALVARSDPALAHALQDGGVPVSGVAREIAGERGRGPGS